MDEKVAKLNIEHYKRLLASETDATKPESIARLLAEEEANLEKISKERRWIYGLSAHWRRNPTAGKAACADPLFVDCVWRRLA